MVKTGTELQIAGTWKRIAAGLFDGLLVLVLAVGVWLLLAPVTGYDRHSKALDETYAQYEAHYGISFSITQEEYEARPEEERATYDEALDALNQDEEALESYNKILSLMLLLVSASLLGVSRTLSPTHLLVLPPASVVRLDWVAPLQVSVVPSFLMASFPTCFWRFTPYI